MAGDFEEVLHALGRAGVRYLIVGGVAVVLHGHLRAAGRPQDRHDVERLRALHKEDDRR